MNAEQLKHAAEIADEAANYLTSQQVLPCDEGNAFAEGLTTLAMNLRETLVMNIREGAPQSVNMALLRAVTELLEVVDGGGEPLDWEETEREIYHRAVAARDAAVKGIEPKKLRVLCHVHGGVASLAYDPGIEHIVIDEDDGGPIDVPSDWQDLADQLDIVSDDPDSEVWHCNDCGAEGDGNDFSSTKRPGLMACSGCGSIEVARVDDEETDEE